MKPVSGPLPANEPERVAKLADYDLDYTDLDGIFKDLLTLAAKTTGTPISLVNLIDSYTEWTVSSYGLEGSYGPKEDTVCQYTVAGNNDFEVKDLSADDRFRDLRSVTGAPGLRYYYGTPIRTSDGFALGALCVLDLNSRALPPEKIELLRLIAGEIVSRLETIKVVNELRSKVKTATEMQKRIVHDIRGPIGGIIGLADIISEQGDENSLEEVLEFIRMIKKSGNSILELANEILSAGQPGEGREPGSGEFNQHQLKEKLGKLYGLQASNKGVRFMVNTCKNSDTIPFRRNKILQIAGNIISNAIKFTPKGGSVSVGLLLEQQAEGPAMVITVTDTGIGMDHEKVNELLTGTGTTTTGTDGERGYGFGLGLVKHLVDSISGTLEITSEPGKGTTFTVRLPQ